MTQQKLSKINKFFLIFLKDLLLFLGEIQNKVIMNNSDWMLGIDPGAIERSRIIILSNKPKQQTNLYTRQSDTAANTPRNDHTSRRFPVNRIL
jgi:hypothetical protein